MKELKCPECGKELRLRHYVLQCTDFKVYELEDDLFAKVGGRVCHKEDHGVANQLFCMNCGKTFTVNPPCRLDKDVFRVTDIVDGSYYKPHLAL